MAKTPKTELFINVVHKIDQDREYGRFESIFLVREEPATCEDTGLRNPSGSHGFGLGLYNGLFLDDLTLSALYRRATAEKRLTFMLDAMAYRRPFSVNERTAMAMIPASAPSPTAATNSSAQTISCTERDSVISMRATA